MSLALSSLGDDPFATGCLGGNLKIIQDIGHFEWGNPMVVELV